MSSDDEAGISVPKLVTAPSDRELAGDLRLRLEAALAPAIDLLKEADSHGLQVSWTVGRDNFGRLKLMDINIARPL